MAYCPECGEGIPETASYCPECGEQVAGENGASSEDDDDSIGCFGALGLIAVIALLVGLCSGPGDTEEAAQTNEASSESVAKVGEVMRTGEACPCPLAVSDRAWERMQDAAAAKDQMGFEQLVRSGQVVLVDPGRRARMIELGFTSRRVRMLEGPSEGTAGWMAPEYLRPE